MHTLALFADGNHPQVAFARPCNDLVRPDIICPDDGAAIFIDDLIEQTHLGVEIAFHRAMIIKMIAAQIRECGDRNPNAFAAILRQAVAGRFKYRVTYAFAGQTGHVRKKGHDVGRCQSRRRLVRRRRNAQCADRRRIMPRHAPQLAGEFSG